MQLLRLQLLLLPPPQAFAAGEDTALAPLTPAINKGLTLNPAAAAAPANTGVCGR